MTDATCQHYYWPVPGTPGHLCGKPATHLGKALTSGPTYRCEKHQYDLSQETKMKLGKREERA